METTLDYDKLGHCVKCHRNLIHEEVIDEEVKMRFDSDFDQTEYLLDDNSRMRVCMCKPCKSKLSDDWQDEIMECVIKGWEVDVDNMVKNNKDWDEERKKKHMEAYNKRRIICNSDGVSEEDLKIKKG